MPPNLGGFFMVRSYYPSECNAEIGERFSRNAETDLVCRLLREKKQSDSIRASWTAEPSTYWYSPWAGRSTGDGTAGLEGELSAMARMGRCGPELPTCPGRAS